MGDADAGANNLQNFPTITGVAVGGGNTTVTGTLNSVANTNFRLEFFASPGRRPSGYGEGQVYLGFVNVTTNAAGNLGCAFSYVKAGYVLPAGWVISATATRSNATFTTFTDTSEFSPAVGMQSISGTILNDVNANANVADDGAVFAGATVRLYFDSGTSAGAIDAGDTLLATTLTDAFGGYTFTTLPNGNYYVVVDSKTLTAGSYTAGKSISNVWADQTYGVAGGGEQRRGDDFHRGRRRALRRPRCRHFRQRDGPNHAEHVTKSTSRERTSGTSTPASASTLSTTFAATRPTTTVGRSAPDAARFAPPVHPERRCDHRRKHYALRAGGCDQRVRQRRQLVEDHRRDERTSGHHRCEHDDRRHCLQQRRRRDCGQSERRPGRNRRYSRSRWTHTGQGQPARAGADRRRGVRSGRHLDQRGHGDGQEPRGEYVYREPDLRQLHGHGLNRTGRSSRATSSARTPTGRMAAGPRASGSEPTVP